MIGIDKTALLSVNVADLIINRCPLTDTYRIWGLHQPNQSLETIIQLSRFFLKSTPMYQHFNVGMEGPTFASLVLMAQVPFHIVVYG